MLSSFTFYYYYYILSFYTRLRLVLVGIGNRERGEGSFDAVDPNPTALRRRVTCPGSTAPDSDRYHLRIYRRRLRLGLCHQSSPLLSSPSTSTKLAGRWVYDGRPTSSRDPCATHGYGSFLFLMILLVFERKKPINTFTCRSILQRGRRRSGSPCPCAGVWGPRLPGGVLLVPPRPPYGGALRSGHRGGHPPRQHQLVHRRLRPGSQDRDWDRHRHRHRGQLLPALHPVLGGRHGERHPRRRGRHESRRRQPRDGHLGLHALHEPKASQSSSPSPVPFYLLIISSLAEKRREEN